MGKQSKLVLKLHKFVFFGNKSNKKYESTDELNSYQNGLIPKSLSSLFALLKNRDKYVSGH